MTDRLTAATITDTQLDDLYRRIETLEHVAAGNKQHVRTIVPEIARLTAELEDAERAADRFRRAAERAETALERVRALATPAATITTAAGVHEYNISRLDIARHVLATLDASGPGATEATGTGRPPKPCCGAAIGHLPGCPTNQPEPAPTGTEETQNSALREVVAAAIWERQNPVGRWTDCGPRDRADAEADADAIRNQNQEQ